MGEVGSLLDRMLSAINLKRESVYITNLLNYITPDDRKPTSAEINRYLEFLIEHIFIINPKILVIVGSTAMEALVGKNIKISKERGQWKELLFKDKTFLSIITFHPSYLLRQPEQKKYSWEDLKKIKQKIQDLKIKI